MHPIIAEIKIPFIACVVAVVGATAASGAFIAYHNLQNPVVVLSNRKENPFPYVNLKQSTNLKLYAVNRKFEGGVKEHYMDGLQKKKKNF
ncbi:hypothetical protein HDU92_003493 [Lobulomyces angularis]|nr:hypothetical protein HDU92_003493 [Lobulomyces angularis]